MNTVNDRLQLPQNTLLKIKHLATETHNEDYGSILAQCVNLADMLIGHINKGDSIFIESKNGQTFELNLPTGF